MHIGQANVVGKTRVTGSSDGNQTGHRSSLAGCGVRLPTLTQSATGC
jgi:hypothetical protein